LLHAASLAFDHPAEDRRVSIDSPGTPLFLALVEEIGAADVSRKGGAS
jgi:hypothetical protein